MAILEAYALSDDKEKFLEALPEGIDKKVLQALLMPYTSDLLDNLVRSGVPRLLAQEI